MPGTVQSPAAPSQSKQSLHRIGSGRYLQHMTEAGTRVGAVQIQIDPSSLCNSRLFILQFYESHCIKGNIT